MALKKYYIRTHQISTSIKKLLDSNQRQLLLDCVKADKSMEVSYVLEKLIAQSAVT